MMRKILTLLLLLLFAWPVQFARSQAVSIRPDAITGSQVNISCGTVATSALAATARRRAWVVKAPAANTADIFIGFNSGVTTGNGIPLGAGATVDDDTYIGEVFCIVAVGTQNLRVSETRR